MSKKEFITVEKERLKKIEKNLSELSDEAITAIAANTDNISRTQAMVDLFFRFAAEMSDMSLELFEIIYTSEGSRTAQKSTDKLKTGDS